MAAVAGTRAVAVEEVDVVKGGVREANFLRGAEASVIEREGLTPAGVVHGTDKEKKPSPERKQVGDRNSDPPTGEKGAKARDAEGSHGAGGKKGDRDGGYRAGTRHSNRKNTVEVPAGATRFVAPALMGTPRNRAQARGGGRRGEGGTHPRVR